MWHARLVRQGVRLRTIVRRYETSDEDWAQIQPLLPRQKRDGKWSDDRTVMNGMFWVLRSGSAWRSMPERYGKWQTIYDRFVRRRNDGTLARIADTLKQRLRGKGRIEWEIWCVDGTNVRAMKAEVGLKKNPRRTSPKTTH